MWCWLVAVVAVVALVAFVLVSDPQPSCLELSRCFR